MSVKGTLTPRAAAWRGRKVGKASKIWTTRALEKDRERLRAAPAAPVEQPVKRQTEARTFWQRLPRWANNEG